METNALSSISSRPRVLICARVDGLKSLLEDLRARGYEAKQMPLSRPISLNMRALLATVDIVLLDLTASSVGILNAIREVISAIGIGGLRPRLLCFSMSHRNIDFILDVQNSGGRYVRISTPDMLLEAVDLLAAEISALESKGPQFSIVHRFSTGFCAPGEEISAVLLDGSADSLQLPLGPTERFVFDFIAQRRLAVDSLQIVSGLSGDWFYREHASNSGHRQLRRIRRATVKVSVQRIRDAMTSVFGLAKADFDSRDVLRSCLAEGTNRVLYKLCARVRWRHIR